ncbi:hypothetical protein GGR56DRAFT_179365 [Xylariaceae sp. FL0804]|nr:hypothetical protein GGR56DRAFT_179365 [Xylariaceae sp. FL0804]
MQNAMDQGTFPDFSRLPAELRDQIWGYALPEPRVYEVLDTPSQRHSRSEPTCHLMFADIRNEPPPPMARVCHDARQAVLRRYKPLVFSGTVKHIDLSRDIILLDSYLQVRRLLKVMRLLSQVDHVRRAMARLALGTSWGVHTGLHLRLFHRTVRTRRNMDKFLEHSSKFRNLKTIILVVYQQSAFSLGPLGSDHQLLPWQHYDIWQPYHSNYNVNFNSDNYWVRRPYQRALVKYIPDISNGDKCQATPRPARHCPQCEAQPHGHQVHRLKATFEGWIQTIQNDPDSQLGPLVETPRLETATLTWVYTDINSGCFYPRSEGHAL